MELDDTLEYTNGIRKDIITKLTKDGELPKDLGSKQLLTSMLDGMDRGVAGKARLDLQQEKNKTDTDMIGMVSSLLLNIQTTPTKTSDVSLPRELPGNVVTENIVPGEMDINPLELEYEDFVEE